MRVRSAAASILLSSLLSSLLLWPALAGAQGTLTTDPNAAPQGRMGQTVGDTQVNAEAGYREAQAQCRNVTPARQQQDCIRQALQDYGTGTRTRRPTVQVRPASGAEAAAPAASAASR
jgi:hypothetical protein